VDSVLDFGILLHMVKQILIELDDDTAAKLERVAPARSRRRSAFIRQAIWRALWELEEKEVRAAYLRDIDPVKPKWPDASWDPWPGDERQRPPGKR
jgi:predicted DNA-binding protein